MAHGSARDKGKSRAIQPHPQPEASVASLTTLALSSRAQPHPHPHPPPPSRPQPPHMTMPLSPPKTSPSPPGLPPFPGEEPNDVFSQAGPSRQPIQHAPAMRGPPIDVDAVEPSSTPVEVDLVVQCKACRTIVGDSSAYVAARKDLGLLVLSSVAQHVVLSNPPSTSQDPDLNSLYMPLDITCGSCGSPLGKVYRMTAAGLDELRDGYSFERDRIAVYQLGTGVRSPMLAPLHPDRQANRRDQDWRRPPTGPNGSSEDVYSPQQHHRDRSPPPHVPPHERMMGGVPPTPGQGHLPYHQQATPGGAGPYSMYNRPPSLAPMRRTPSIAPPMSIRGSVGPLSMRGSMTPGPAGGAGATVASLKQKAIMIEMGDRIKSLEGGIGSMDERVRSMLDERMGPVEGLLREIIRGQASLAGGVGSGTGSGSGSSSSAERVEERRQPTSASVSTTTPQRPATSGPNGSSGGEGATSATRSTAVTPTANNGGMPPPTSVPRSTGSSNRIPKSILSSLSGTPLRKRIVDQRKGAGQSPGVVAAERAQAAQTQAQSQGQANAAFQSPAGMVSPRSNVPTQPAAQAGSPHKPSLSTIGAVLSHRQGSPSLPVSGPGPGQEAAGAAPPTAQYEHDELDGLDNSFDGLDGDVLEAHGGSNESDRNGAGAVPRAAGGSGAARGRKRKAV